MHLFALIQLWEAASASYHSPYGKQVSTSNKRNAFYAVISIENRTLKMPREKGGNGILCALPPVTAAFAAYGSRTHGTPCSLVEVTVPFASRHLILFIGSINLFVNIYSANCFHSILAARCGHIPGLPHAMP